MRVKNWEKWQSYRSDRGQPPWIKVHRRLVHDENWAELTDAQRGQLVAIWMLAADRDGVIPASPRVLQKLCMMTDEPDIQVLINKGFIDGDVNPTPNERQPDANVTAQIREEEVKRREESNGARAPLAFVGRVISLTQGDYDQWVQSFPNVDLRAYLEARDVFLFDLPADDNRRRKWMPSTASDLRNKNSAPVKSFEPRVAGGSSRAGLVTGYKKFEPEPPRKSRTPEEQAAIDAKVRSVMRRATNSLREN